MSKELAAFRWHSDSLTVRQRKASVREASMVRRRNQTLMVRMVLSPLEPLIRFATLYGPVIFKKTS